MTSSKTKTKPVTKNAVVPQKSGAVARSVAEAAAKYAGEGISHRMEDNIVPLIYLLQSNSKPATRGHEKFVKGAEGGGKIWLRNDPPATSLIDGDEGMLFQPCKLNVVFIEWMPDRGGFVARHTTRPKEAVLKDVIGDDGKTRKAWRMPNDNVIGESREFPGFVHRDDQRQPYTLLMGGTNLTVAKAWMTSMRDTRLPDGKECPLFANLYRVKTKLRTVDKNSWFMYDIALEGPVPDVEDVERGHQLHQAFLTGEKQSAGIEDVEGKTTGVDGDDDI